MKYKIKKKYRIKKRDKLQKRLYDRFRLESLLRLIDRLGVQVYDDRVYDDQGLNQLYGRLWIRLNRRLERYEV